VAARRLVRLHPANRECGRVSTLERSERADGSIWFRIDGGNEFKLPPALAALLSMTNAWEVIGWLTCG
jgi:hypothetical protein